MWEFVKRLTYPKGWITKLSAVFGAASIFKLANEGFNIGLLPIFDKILSFYDQFLEFIFGWAAPLLESAFAYLGWEIIIRAHWKHVLVLMSVYLIRSVQTSYRNHRPTGIFRAIHGFTIALLVSIGAGSLQIMNPDWQTVFLFTSIPVLGLFFYGTFNGIWQATFRRNIEEHRRGLMTWLSIFQGHLFAAMRRTIVALIFLFAGTQILVIQQLTSPGIALLAVLAILHAVYNLREGIHQRYSGPSSNTAYWDTDGAQIGLDMLRFFWIAALFAIINLGFS